MEHDQPIYKSNKNMKNLSSLGKIKKAQKIIQIFKQKGFEAFIVGGAVRDYLLNIPFNQDVDITTNAVPQDINAIFQSQKRAYYGCIKIIFEEESFEITTYREEDIYLNHRHPNKIVFIQEVKKDVIRRDFTINALLMDEKGQIFDWTEGKSDLTKKILRTIQNPFISFEKDALRIMRAFYFQAKLNFQIEKQTQIALTKHSHLLTQISSSRIYEYLQKIITYPHWQASFKMMIETKAHLFLKPITKAIIFFASLKDEEFTNKNLEENIFWSIAFVFNKNIFSLFPINSKKKKQCQTLIILSNHIFTNLKLNLFTHQLSNCLLAYKINYLLSPQKSKIFLIENLDNIKQTYKNLPLKNFQELKMDWRQIAPHRIPEIKQKVIQAVLEKKITNELEELKAFVFNHKHNEKVDAWHKKEKKRKKYDKQ